VDEVVVLTLDEGCGTRAPVLALRDALAAAGAAVEVVDAASDPQIDAVIAPGGRRLVVAVAADGQLRAVLRRLVRWYAPPPRSRPDDLPAGRTVPDLPPVGVLPLGPAGEGDTASRLGLPRDPAAVADAVLAGRARRLDLLRTDAGGVTLDGALFGTTGAGGEAVRWHARVEVDDAVLTDGSDMLLAGTIANGTGYSTVDGLPLVTPDPADGVLDVAVAVPVLTRRLLRAPAVRVEVRRTRGRAVSITPLDGDLPYLDDGVAAELGRTRSWWVESGAWAVYVS